MEKILEEGLKPSDIVVTEDMVEDEADTAAVPAAEPVAEKLVESCVAETVEKSASVQPSAEPSGEDLLFKEIDAFRAKATRIRQLIAEKEKKAEELELLVREKEAANLALQQELDRKQAEADSLVADVETQVDRMLSTVKTNMDQLGIDIKDQAETNQETYETHNKSLQESLTQMSQFLDTVTSELSEKTHTESVHLYRLIQNLLQENDVSEEQQAKAEAHYNSLKSIGIVLIIFVILTFGMAAVSLLISLGIL